LCPGLRLAKMIVSVSERKLPVHSPVARGGTPVVRWRRTLMSVASQIPIENVSDDETRARPSRWVVPALSLATFLTMLNAMALGPFLPVISREFNTSVALLGQIPALTMLLAALLGLVIGPLADRIGHRRALLGGLAVAAVGAAGVGLAPGLAVLLVAALIGGIGRAIAQPIAVVIVGTAFHGDQQRRAISWVMAGVTGAVIVGIPAMTTIAGLAGWRAAFVALSAATVALTVLALRLLAPDAERAATRLSLGALLGAYRPLVQHRPSLALICSTLLFTTAVWSMATYIGAFYSDRHGYSIQQIGWVYLVPGVTLVLGSLAIGGRVGTLPLRPLIMIARIIGGVAIATLLIAPLSALAGLGVLAVQGATPGMSGVAVALLLTRDSPAGRATTLTLNVAAISLGTALGSALGGLLLAVAGYWLIGCCACLLAFASSAIVWLWQDRAALDVPVTGRGSER
jgi:MFS transporter, DHA1 family, inner membrane transport protein